MSDGQFFLNPAFIAYVRLLYQLHRAIKEGWDETDEGEALRERMDEPGRGLSGEEIASLGGVSADFYSLMEMAVPDSQEVTAEAMADLESALAARKSSDFNRSLELLRKHAYCVPSGEPGLPSWSDLAGCWRIRHRHRIPATSQ